MRNKSTIREVCRRRSSRSRVAFALRYGLYGTLDNRIPFGFFTLSTLIAAWYGGLGPGMLAAMSGLLLADYFFLPPHSPEGGLGEAARTGIGIYAMTNTLIVVLFWHLHTRLREMRRPAARARGRRAGSRHRRERPPWHAGPGASALESLTNRSSRSLRVQCGCSRACPAYARHDPRALYRNSA